MVQTAAGQPRPALLASHSQRSAFPSAKSPISSSDAESPTPTFVLKEMQSFARRRDSRLRAYRVARQETDRLAGEAARLKKELAFRPHELALGRELDRLESALERQVEAEAVARKALASPTLTGTVRS